MFGVMVKVLLPTEKCYFQAAMEAGEYAESWRPVDRALLKILYAGSVVIVVMTVWNFIQLSQTEPIWPYKKKE